MLLQIAEPHTLPSQGYNFTLPSWCLQDLAFDANSAIQAPRSIVKLTLHLSPNEVHPGLRINPEARLASRAVLHINQSQQTTALRILPTATDKVTTALVPHRPQQRASPLSTYSFIVSRTYTHATLSTCHRNVLLAILSHSFLTIRSTLRRS